MKLFNYSRNELIAVVVIIVFLRLIYMLIHDYRMDCIWSSQAYLGNWCKGYVDGDTSTGLDLTLSSRDKGTWYLHGYVYRAGGKDHELQTTHVDSSGKFTVTNDVIYGSDDKQAPVFAARFHYCNDLTVQFLQQNRDFGWPRTIDFHGASCGKL